jgi:hypothetical protein
MRRTKFFCRAALIMRRSLGGTLSYLEDGGLSSEWSSGATFGYLADLSDLLPKSWFPHLVPHLVDLRVSLLRVSRFLPSQHKMLHSILRTSETMLLTQEEAVHFVKIGNRALNLDSVTHCECQIWHDSTTLKVYVSGAANNTPIVLSEEEAKLLWKYLERVAEKPVD